MIQFFQYLRLVRFACRAVFAQFLCQKINVRGRLLDIFLFEYRQRNVRQQRCIFQRRLPALGVIAQVQVRQRRFPLRAIGNQLNKGIFLVVVGVDLGIDGRQPLRRCHNGIFIDRDVCIVLSASLRTGNLRIELPANGFKALGITRIRNEIVFDLDGFACVDEFLQADFIIFREQLRLSLFEQLGDFLVHAVQRVKIGLHLLG